MTSMPSRKQRAVLRRTTVLLLPMLVLLIADRLIAPHYRLALNESDSLPGTVFLVETGDLPRCGTTSGEHVQIQMRADARWVPGCAPAQSGEGLPRGRDPG